MCVCVSTLTAQKQDVLLISFLNCTAVQMSADALAGLGPGLRALTVRGNQLEELPELSTLTGLEVVDLQDNPLLCNCDLLPLRRLVELSLDLGFYKSFGKDGLPDITLLNDNSMLLVNESECKYV